MSRLPIPGSDANTWGDILNEFLAQEHNTDGSQKPLAQSKITDLAAKVDATRTVNGHALSSNVVITKSDVGLASVDNTSDVNKPVSNPQQAAIDADRARLSTIENGDYVFTKLKFPNVTITDEANPLVNAVQFGEDASGVLKDQHISSADQLGTGMAAGITMNPGTANGLNQNGAPLRLAVGISTGSGTGGGVVILTSGPGVSGVQQNIQQSAWYFWGGELLRALTPATDNTQDLGYDVLRIANVKMGGYIQATKTTDPAAPAANTGRTYFRDNGSGKMQFCVQFPTGGVQVLATEP